MNAGFFQGFFARTGKNECDWLVMSSAFVASQSRVSRSLIFHEPNTKEINVQSVFGNQRKSASTLR
jgi:hypothetical protein